MSLLRILNDKRTIILGTTDHRFRVDGPWPANAIFMGLIVVGIGSVFLGAYRDITRVRNR